MLAIQHEKKKTVKILLIVVAVALIGGVLIGINKVYFSQSSRVDPQRPIDKVSKSVGGNISHVDQKITPDYVLPPVKNGIAPLLTTIPTKQPVVFLGIDDGAFKDPSELKMMQDNQIKASLFLSNAFISNNPDFFKQFTQTGSLIEDHTLHHYTDLPKRAYEEQKSEICGEADYMLKEYGRRPVLFRPPGGSYTVTTQRAAAACGMKATINWIAKANGGSMQYQIGGKLRPGDIVLMHFRPAFKQDMQAFIDAEQAAGLHTVLLEDWLSADKTS